MAAFELACVATHPGVFSSQGDLSA